MEGKNEIVRGRLVRIREIGQEIIENTHSIERILTENRLISEELILSTLAKLSEVKMEYAILRANFAEFFQRELPESFDEIDKILVEEEERVKSASLRDRAALFMKLTAKDKSAQNLLKKAQSKLNAALKKDVPDEELKGYLDFIEAMEAKDSSEAIAYVPKLMPYFDQKLIAQALIERAIVLPVEETSEETRGEEEENILDDDKAVKKALAAEYKERFESLIAELGFKPLTQDDYGEFEYDYSNRESKEFKQSKFIKEVLSTAPYTREKKFFLRFINTVGVLSVEFLSAVTSRESQVWQHIADFLFTKGYLRRYSFAGIGEFYGTSPRFGELTASQGATTALGIPRQKKRDVSEWLDPDPTYAAPRLAYLRIVTAMVLERRKAYLAKKSGASRLGGAEIVSKLIPGFPYMVNDAFFYFRTEKNNEDLLVGCFWTSNDNLEKFMAEFLVAYTEEKQPMRVIVSALTKTACLVAYDLLEAIADDEWGTKIPVYFYAFLEGKFYAGLDQQDIDAQAIWGNDVSADDEDDDDDAAEEDERESEKSSAAAVSAVSESPAPVKPTTSPAVSLPKEKPAPVAQVAPPAVKREVLPPVPLAPLTPLKEPNVVACAAEMIVNNRIYCATAYLKACSLAAPELEDAYLRLAYAAGDPLLQGGYPSDKIYGLFNSAAGPWEESLMTAASLRSFLLDSAGFDYEMPILHDALKQCSVVDEVAPLNDLLYVMMEFKRDNHKGIDHYADYRAKNRVQLERQLENIRRSAKDAYNNFIDGNIKEKAKQRRFLETKKLIFDRENYLANFLTAVIDNDTDSLNLMREYVLETFMRDDALLDKQNIDPLKMDTLVDEAWEEAGRRILRLKKNMDLMGSLRNNLCNAIAKVVDILCQWIVCVDSLGEESDDSGRAAYKKIVKKLRDNTEAAMDDLMQRETTAKETEERAGFILIIKTLGEIMERIQGTYSPERSRYFYVDFLRGSDVLLDDDYRPDFVHEFDADPHVSVIERIKTHAAAKLMSAEDRVRYAFEGGGDDFRSARMLDDCLRERFGKSVIEAASYDVKTSIEYARTDANKIKDDFIENLELAQSYGQIDNARENKKEKILQIINEWHDYAMETTDFGVFKRVKEYWEAKIREDARTRETVLRQEIDSSLETLKNAPDFDSRMEKIRQMIGQQNYTVAEDMLHRLSRGEAEMDTPMFEDDSLRDFLDNYEFYYGKVSRNSYSLSKLLGTRQRNKDERGGAKLAENWVVNGGRTGAAKMEKLLVTLGFAVEKVTDLNGLGQGKIEGYNVTLKRPLNGQKANYKHPIAAFGSTAEETGFRVACLFGKYDADGLIERFKEIGAAKPTIVMLDYSLPLSDRRRLARKVRSELFEKVMGIIDRVLLMYLINHYNEMRVSQMLMALMMPFAYYQPYVWESGKVMPPEIFMGRKEELAKIESAEGVNIVYGGRQLGKSAMLKMAKNDIDRDENNDRAILVDIKDKDSRETALKISRALNDEGFFENEPETDNWDELARAIKKRLTSKTAPHIPYFLLLLDEADAFIESCATDNYHAFDALKDIQSVGVGRFKFVIAGLRNIIRFNRQAALGNNNVITHLASMTVKPFKVQEARELLEVPLYYLGLRFPQGKESLISLILASTNYFPGLIQLYCAKLIEAMSKSDYAGYNQGEVPVYEIREDHIKKVLADASFTEQIREKFEITLKLGDDRNYYIIALIFAYLYHENGAGSYNDGYGADDILLKAESLELEEIYNLSTETVTALLEDLRELNILRATVAGKYLFTRYAFFQMLGSREEVEDKILALMEEGA